MRLGQPYKATSTGDVYVGKGTLLRVLLTAGSADATLAITDGSGGTHLADVSAKAGTSVPVPIEVPFQTAVTFTITGTGAIAYAYL